LAPEKRASSTESLVAKNSPVVDELARLGAALGEHRRMFSPRPIATREELLVLGWTPAAIAAAVRAGTLLRLRRAWYAAPDTPLEQRIAIAMGGRVGGVSAARSYGMWTGNDDQIHVSWSPHGNVAVAGRRLAYPHVKELASRVIVPHWRVGVAGPDSWRESVIESIRQTAAVCDPALTVAMADSACRIGLATVDTLRTLLLSLPRRFHTLGGAIDGCTDSGLESIVRLWLLEAGIPFLLHAGILGLEVDFLIGRSLIIETDGRDFHTGPAFETDRERDLATGSHGYVTIRLSYRQIMTNWPACVDRILAALERGDHQRSVH
jgi:very-short-patch-repair endonuclease